MSFRIGRRHASHTYPESKGVGALAFARNFAFGPAAPYEVTDTPTRIPWGTIDSGAAPGQSVPITPTVTGLILVQGVVECVNSSEDAEQLTVQVGVNGVLQATPLEAGFVNGGAGEQTSVPFQTRLGPFPLGVLVNISLFVSANSIGDLSLEVGDSTLSVQEVPPATG
jgi:hypothetical protein